jgi:hypothetical protein
MAEPAGNWTSRFKGNSLGLLGLAAFGFLEYRKRSEDRSLYDPVPFVAPLGLPYLGRAIGGESLEALGARAVGPAMLILYDGPHLYSGLKSGDYDKAAGAGGRIGGGILGGELGLIAPPGWQAVTVPGGMIAGAILGDHALTALYRRFQNHGFYNAIDASLANASKDLLENYPIIKALKDVKAAADKGEIGREAYEKQILNMALLGKRGEEELIALTQGQSGSGHVTQFYTDHHRNVPYELGEKIPTRDQVSTAASKTPDSKGDVSTGGNFYFLAQRDKRIWTLIGLVSDDQKRGGSFLDPRFQAMTEEDFRGAKPDLIHLALSELSGGELELLRDPQKRAEYHQRIRNELIDRIADRMPAAGELKNNPALKDNPVFMGLAEQNDAQAAQARERAAQTSPFYYGPEAIESPEQIEMAAAANRLKTDLAKLSDSELDRLATYTRVNYADVFKIPSKQEFETNPKWAFLRDNVQIKPLVELANGKNYVGAFEYMSSKNVADEMFALLRDGNRLQAYNVETKGKLIDLIAWNMPAVEQVKANPALSNDPAFSDFRDLAAQLDRMKSDYKAAYGGALKKEETDSLYSKDIVAGLSSMPDGELVNLIHAMQNPRWTREQTTGAAPLPPQAALPETDTGDRSRLRTGLAENGIPSQTNGAKLTDTVTPAIC